MYSFDWETDFHVIRLITVHRIFPQSHLIWEWMESEKTTPYKIPFESVKCLVYLQQHYHINHSLRCQTNECPDFWRELSSRPHKCNIKYSHYVCEWKCSGETHVDQFDTFGEREKKKQQSNRNITCVFSWLKSWCLLAHQWGICV